MRMLGVIEHPTQHEVLQGTCGYTTELPLNQELVRVHWGEDGPGYGVIVNREFTLTRQQSNGDWQEWYWGELIDDAYLDD